VPTAYNALGTAGTTMITMAAGSTITTRNAGSPFFPAITLTGNATINFGNSTQAPAQADFNHPITGPHTLTLTSNGQGTQPLVELKAANSFSALVIQDIGGRGNPADTFRANVAGALGNGNVTVLGLSASSRSPQIRFSASNAMADSGILYLNGLGPTASGADRLVMDNGVTDTIAGLYLSGVKQISGVYTKAGIGSAFMGTGTGALTVGSSPTVYWDIDDATPGAGGTAPAGTWDSLTANWSPVQAGNAAASTWVAGQTARFAATGATDTYTVSVSGTQDVAGLGFDQGTVTLSGGGLRMVDNMPVFVASGVSAILGSTLSQDVPGRELHKSGAGTLTLSGSGNSYTGGAFVGAGMLNADSTDALGTGPVTLVAGALNLNAAQSISGVTVNGGTLRFAHADAVASASAVNINAGGLTLQMRENSAATFNGAPVNFTPTANTQQFTINVDNNGAGSGNQLVLAGGFNRRVNVNQNTAANGMTLNITGGNGYSLQIPTVNLTGGMSTTLNPTTANLDIGSINATTGTTAFGTANNIVLTLGGGAASVNSITSITETSNAAQQLIINKNTSATWTLGNVDTKQGNGHAMSAGTLTLNGTFKFAQAADRKFTVSGGVLNYNNAAAIQTHASTTSGNGFVISGGSLDNTSGAAITTSTHNPRMTWGGNWTFIGTNGANSDLNLGSGAVFLTGTRQVSVTNPATTLTVGGTISGTGFGLTKDGPGTLVLGGTNTYTGDTSVSSGSLILNGSSPAAGLIFVFSAATLGGGGSGGSTFTADDAVLSPGTADGSGDNFFALAGLSMSGNSVFRFEPGTPSNTYYTDPNDSPLTDHLTVTGPLILDGKLLIADRPDASSYNMATAAAGDRWLVMSYSDTLDNQALEIDPASAPLSSGLYYTLNTLSNPGHVYLEVAAVPEPGTVWLVLAGFSLLRVLRRRA
jgi:autotransporter-associated beta strand protein